MVSTEMENTATDADSTLDSLDLYYQGSIFNVWEQFDKSFIICLFLCNFS